MALNDPALAELAEHFGIAQEFWDWKGRHTEISDQTVVAVLKSLEIDASSPEKAREALEELPREEHAGAAGVGDPAPHVDRGGDAGLVLARDRE